MKLQTKRKSPRENLIHTHMKPNHAMMCAKKYHRLVWNSQLLNLDNVKQIMHSTLSETGSIKKVNINIKDVVIAQWDTHEG